MENLQPVFDRYAQIYNDIFKDFYPSVKSTGFTERNQTVNWSKAYELTHPNDDVLTWFEFPFSEKEYEKHLDAIIFNRKNGALFLIESKRFSNTTGKVSSVGIDIHRICDLRKTLLTDSRFVKIKSHIKEIQGVILADLWNENDAKRALVESFKKHSFLLDYAETLKLNKEISESVSQTVKYFDLSIENMKNWSEYEYHLLGMVFKL